MGEIKIAVKGIILKDNKMLIVQRSTTDTVGAGTWENVGGSLEFGESFEEALHREFLEEVGLNVTIQKLLYATSFLTSSSRQIVLLAFLCSCEHIDVTLSNEHDQFLWATKEELIKLLPKEIIADYDQHGILKLLSE